MIEHAINFILFFYDIPRRVGLEVKDFGNLIGALFLLVTLVMVLTELYDRIKKSKKEKKVFLTPGTKEKIGTHTCEMGTY